ncbi:MAG: hypothetical protein FJW37_03025 [Acidobacteria bacterium]|nr:hypothetical protein [Acidobacteriota bacterium]
MALFCLALSGFVTEAYAQAVKGTADLTEGYVQSWNLALQRSLPLQFVFEVAYVGNQAVKLQTYRDINASRTLGSGAAGQPLFQLFRRTTAVSGYQPTNSHYHSLQAKFDRRLAPNFLLTTSYTYSRQIDIDFYQQINLSLNRARGGSDRTHVFVQSYIYEFPFGKGQRWVRSGPGSWILGGWQFTGIFTSMTGLPLNITGGGVLNTPGSSNRPNISGKPEIFGRVGPGQKWLDVSKFSDPGIGVLGNTGRNILTGPGFVNLDFSVFRRFTITERFRLELRGESFNLSNTPHFGNPNMGFGSASFGEISGADNDFTDPASRRQIQLGLKLTF